MPLFSVFLGSTLAVAGMTSLILYLSGQSETTEFDYYPASFARTMIMEGAQAVDTSYAWAQALVGLFLMLVGMVIRRFVFLDKCCVTCCVRPRPRQRNPLDSAEPGSGALLDAIFRFKQRANAPRIHETEVRLLSASLPRPCRVPAASGRSVSRCDAA